MSSDVQVKDEPVLENEFNAETDSEAEAEDDIDLDKLQPLDPKFAAFTKFPIGCKVWYDLCKSTTPTKCLQAKSAYVEEAYIHFENHKKVYKVKSETTEDEATLYEERLIYGANCPVTVTSQDTNEVRNGVIICPKLDQGKENDRKKRISYAIQFWQDKKVSIEFGVAAEGVKYRMEVKASTDNGRNGGRAVAAKGIAGNESCETNEEARIDELSTNKAGGIQSTETHHLPGRITGDDDDEEEGEIVETMLQDNASLTEANERPKKVARTTNNEKECRCVLLIPTWFEERRGLFRKCLFYTIYISSFSHLFSAEGHLIGEDGHKTRYIKSTTTCSVRITRHDDATKGPMTITITSGSSCDVTQTSPYLNVGKAVALLEQSILEYLSDRDTEKKMLHELAAKANASFKLFPRESGAVQRRYDGVKKWSRVLGLSYNWRQQGDDPDKWLQDLKTLQSNECKIEVFDYPSRTNPYVFISGRKREVQRITTEVASAMRMRSRRKSGPKW